MEEGLDGDAGAVGAEAFVVLGITVGLGIAGVEAADAVVDVPARFAKLGGEGEADVTPVVVACGDVNAGRFDAPGDEFDVVLRVGVRGIVSCGRGRFFGQPLFRVEFVHILNE